MTNDLFYSYCKLGKIDKVLYYLHDKTIDPSYDNNKALFSAIVKDEFNIVDILLKDYRVLEKLSLEQINVILQYRDNELLQYLKDNSITFSQLKLHIQDLIKNGKENKKDRDIMKYLLENGIKLV